MKNLLKIIIILVLADNLVSLSVDEIVNETLIKINAGRVDKNIIDRVRKDPDYYTLKDDVRIEIKEIPTPQVLEISTHQLNNSNTTKGSNIKGIVDTIVIIDNIVNIASKIWNMIVDGKPVAGVDTKYACALPAGVSSPSELSGWSKPKTYLMSFYFENVYGIDVIKVSYQVTYVYGGSYKGKGKYLAAVWAIPVNVEVMWGFSFNMYAYVPTETVVNVGTSKNPIAALQLRISWSASSILKRVVGTDVYYIQGDGYFKQIASPFKKGNFDLSKISNFN